MAETRVLLRPRVEVAEATHSGLDPAKQVNEDALGVRQTRLGFLAVVCDGMGGHVGGREASAAAIHELLGLDESLAPAEAMRDAVTRAHAAIRRLPTPSGSLDGPSRPGSTVVALLLTPESGVVAHVGDSRLYRIANGRIEALTQDHTKVRYLVEMGQLRPEDAATHPERNQIVRALGIGDSIDIEVTSFGFQRGDVFLLASDGLTDLVGAEEMSTALLGAAFADVPQKLVDLANQRGGHDNISVVLVRALESASGGATVVLEEVGARSAGAPTIPNGPPSARTDMQLAAAPFVPSWTDSAREPPTRPPMTSLPEGRKVLPIMFVVAVIFLLGTVAGYFYFRANHHHEHRTPSFVGTPPAVEPAATTATGTATPEVTPEIPSLPRLDAGTR